MSKMLTTKKLKKMNNAEIFASGTTEILHPWFNHLKDKSSKFRKVNWVAARGNGFHDWTIYHSLDANLEAAGFLDGDNHLKFPNDFIYRWGAKLYDKDKIRELVPCTDKAFKLYRF